MPRTGHMQQLRGSRLVAMLVALSMLAQSFPREGLAWAAEALAGLSSRVAPVVATAISDAADAEVALVSLVADGLLRAVPPRAAATSATHGTASPAPLAATDGEAGDAGGGSATDDAGPSAGRARRSRRPSSLMGGAAAAFSVPALAAASADDVVVWWGLEGDDTLHLAGSQTAYATNSSTDAARGWATDVNKAAVTTVVFDGPLAPQTMALWFADFSLLREVDGLSGLDASGVTSLQQAFQGCSSLASLDLSGLNLTSVATLFFAFSDCSGLVSLELPAFSSALADMTSAFAGCRSLATFDASGFDARNVRSTSGLFQDCSSLRVLDLSGFETTTALTTMTQMFRRCSSLRVLDLSGLATAGVTDMSLLVLDCVALDHMRLGDGWDTSGLVEGPAFPKAMFDLADGAGVPSFPAAGPVDLVGYVPAPLYWDLSDAGTLALGASAAGARSAAAGTSVAAGVLPAAGLSAEAWTDAASDVGWHAYRDSVRGVVVDGAGAVAPLSMAAWFAGCAGLAQAGLSGLDISHVEDLSGLFSGCGALQQAALSDWTPVSAITMEGAFEGCSSLTTVVAPANAQWGQLAGLRSAGMFAGCPNLVGGQGTRLVDTAAGTGAAYARVDGGASRPGYLTPVDFTVRFEGNGASGGSTEDQSFAWGVSQQLSSSGFELLGHLFDSWNTAPDGSGTRYEAGQPVGNLPADEDGIVTLWAQWSAASYPVTLDFGFSGDVLASGQSLDTGTRLDWARDVAARLRVMLFDVSGQKVFFGDDTFAVGADSDTLRVSTSVSGVAAGSLVPGEELTVVFEQSVGGTWQAMATGEATGTLSKSSTATLSGSSAQTLRVGRRGTDASESALGEVLGFSLTRPVTYGDDLALPTPTRAGYDFDGWFTKTGVRVEDGSDMAWAEGTTLYARWVAHAGISYTVKRYLQSGDTGSYQLASGTGAGGGTQSLSATAGTAVLASAVATAFSGYESPSAFPWDGGASRPAPSRAVEGFAVSGTGSRVVSLYYDRSYAISYDLADDSEVPAVLAGQKDGYGIGEDAFVLSRPTREGYDFVGWELVGSGASGGSGEAKGGTSWFAAPDGTLERGHAGGGLVRITPLELAYDFAYTGDVQVFTAPVAGTYRLEAWGAQGGSTDPVRAAGGLGGYTAATVTLRQGQTVYVCVGGQGDVSVGGYNGGGAGRIYGGGGGGATHFATQDGTLAGIGEDGLAQVLLVAGGGGGTGVSDESVGKTAGGVGSGIGIGGAGGGDAGTKGYSNGSRDGFEGGGGTRGAGGYASTTSLAAAYRGTVSNGGAGSFGQGGQHVVASGEGFGCGGGGGLWGGGGSFRCSAGGGGGAGYAAESVGDVGALSDVVSADGESFDREGVTEPDGSATHVGHDGDGFARVTLLGSGDVRVAELGPSASLQSYTVPASGFYLVEAWGAKGPGEARGGYAYATVALTGASTLSARVPAAGVSTADQDALTFLAMGSDTVPSVTSATADDFGWEDAGVLVAAGGGRWGTMPGHACQEVVRTTAVPRGSTGDRTYRAVWEGVDLSAKVVVFDVFTDADENPLKGNTTRFAAGSSARRLGDGSRHVIGSTVRGSDWGSDQTLNAYNPGYFYYTCTSSTVTKDGAVVYRLFKAYTNINIVDFYTSTAKTAASTPAAATFSVKYGGNDVLEGRHDEETDAQYGLYYDEQIVITDIDIADGYSFYAVKAWTDVTGDLNSTTGWLDSSDDTYAFTVWRGGSVIQICCYSKARYRVRFDGNLAVRTGATATNPNTGAMPDQNFALGESKALTRMTNPSTGMPYYTSLFYETFAGWNTEADGSGTHYDDGEVVQDLTTEGGIVTLYAQWKDPVGRSLVYDANGGTGTMESVSLAGGSVVAQANAFERTGYRFTGWNTMEDGKGVAYAAGDEIETDNAGEFFQNGDLDAALGNPDGASVGSANALWEFSATGAPDPKLPPGHSTYGKMRIRDASFSKVTPELGHTYLVSGWGLPSRTAIANSGFGIYLSRTNGTNNYLSRVGPELVSPRWRSIAYTVTLDTDGYKGSMPIIITPGSRVTTSETWWYWTGLSIRDIETVQGSNLTLYAQWAGNPYSVRYDGNGAEGGTMPAQSFAYGVEKRLLPNAFVRPGWRFLGWSVDQDATSPTYADRETVADLSTEEGATIVLYAVWEEEAYSLGHHYVGGEGPTPANPASYGFATDAFSLAEPTLAGYDLAGWAGTFDEGEGLRSGQEWFHAPSGVLEHGHVGDGHVRVTRLSDGSASDFPYAAPDDETSPNGSYEVVVDGSYLLEAWGASGGGGADPNGSTSSRAGAGGYARGVFELEAGTTLRIYAGQRGSKGQAHAYNGGAGSGGASGYGGGGMTHVSTLDGNAAVVGEAWDPSGALVVAGGGGGADLAGGSVGASGDGSGGAAGGGWGHPGLANGLGVVAAVAGTPGSGGDQEGGSGSGAQGTGSAATNAIAGGGGGGWWGGAGASSNGAGGGGGSGYVRAMSETSPIGETSSGEDAGVPSSGVLDGSGHARVTRLADDGVTAVAVTEYSYNDAVAEGAKGTSAVVPATSSATAGTVQSFSASADGFYLLEAWGAAGGDAHNGPGVAAGGKGGYAHATVRLFAGETLQVCVGGRGSDSSAYPRAGEHALGGFNGGGMSTSNGTWSWGAGGGATHIARGASVVGRTLAEIGERGRSSLLVVAAGGGGGAAYTTGCAGGAGGGEVGAAGVPSTAGTTAVQAGEGGTPFYGGRGKAAGINGRSSGVFGQGGSPDGTAADGTIDGTYYRGGGGGGGLYGGGSGWQGGSGGGSGYVASLSTWQSVVVPKGSSGDRSWYATWEPSDRTASVRVVDLYVSEADATPDRISLPTEGTYIQLGQHWARSLVDLEFQSSKTYHTFDVALGADWGDDPSLGAYYLDYAYAGCSEAAVGATGTVTVYRYFKAWTDVEVFDSVIEHAQYVDDDAYVARFTVTYADGPKMVGLRRGTTETLWLGESLVVEYLEERSTSSILGTVTVSPPDAGVLDANTQQQIYTYTPSRGGGVLSFPFSDQTKYGVIFDGNGATSGETVGQSFLVNESKPLNENGFVRPGHTFTGWNTEADGSGVGYGDGETVTNLCVTGGSRLTLYAQWRTHRYSVEFDANGGSGTPMARQEGVVYDVPTALSANTYTRTGYTFSHWLPAGDDSRSVALPPIGVWDSNDPELVNVTGATGTTVVTVNARGGRYENLLSGAVDVEPGVRYTLSLNYRKTLGPNVPINRDGVYWMGLALTTARPSGTVYIGVPNEVGHLAFDLTDNAEHTGTVEFVAPAGGKIYLTFMGSRLDDGYTHRFELSDLALVPGYADQAEVSALASHEADGEVATLRAQWRPNTYTVAFRKNASDATGSTPSQPFTYDVAARLVANKYVREGYEFRGWSLDPDATDRTYTNQHTGVTNLTDVDGATVDFYAIWWGAYEGHHMVKDLGQPSYTEMGAKATSTYARIGSTVRAGVGGTVAPLASSALSNTAAGYRGVLVSPADPTAPGTIAATTASATMLKDQTHANRFYLYYDIPEHTVAVAQDGHFESVVATGTDRDGQMVAATLDGTNPITLEQGADVGVSYVLDTGYLFDGWSGATVSDGTFVLGGSDVTLTATSKPLTYTIAYDGNGATSGSQAPKTDAKYDVTYDLPTNDDTTLGREHTVTYDYNYANGVPDGQVASQSRTNTTDTAVWELDGWLESAGAAAGTKATTTRNKVTTDGGTVTYFANWKGGVLEAPTPERDGYDFVGWYDAASGGNKVADGGAEFVSGTDRTLWAHWTARDDTPYKVYHYQQNPTGSAYTLADSETARSGISDSAIGSADVGRTYTGFATSPAMYAYVGVATAGETTLPAASARRTRPSGAGVPSTQLLAAGTRVICLYYDRLTFPLELGGDDHVAGVAGSGSGYRYQRQVEVGVTMEPGYEFDGWDVVAGGIDAPAYVSDTSAIPATASSTVTMPDARVRLVATSRASTYSIGYDEGTPAAAAGLGNAVSGMPGVTSYQVTTADIALPDPTLRGYSFAGWDVGLAQEGASLKDNPTLSGVGGLVIRQGSYGNLALTATWSKDVYSITYHDGKGTGSTTPAMPDNPPSYSVDTTGFVVRNPTRDGYDFAGWTGTGLAAATTALSVPQNSVGDRVYTATWTPVSYTVAFDENGGAAGTTGSLAKTYDEALALPTASAGTAPTRDGYDFLGWTTAASRRDFTADTNPAPEPLYTDSLGTDLATTGGTVTLYAVWRARTDTVYRVRHWTRDVNAASGTHGDANYSLRDTELMTGVTDTQTAAVANDYEGFSAEAFSQANVDGNGRRIVDVWYARDSYDVAVPRPSAAATDGTAPIASVGYRLGGDNDNTLPADVTPVTDGVVRVQYGQRLEVVVGLRPGYEVPSDANGAEWGASEGIASVTGFTTCADAGTATATVSSMPADTAAAITLAPSRVAYVIAYDYGRPDEAPEGLQVVEIAHPKTSYVVTETLDIADAPQLFGYTFTGWSVEAAQGNAASRVVAELHDDGRDTGVSAAAGTYGNFTLRAHWRADEHEIVLGGLRGGAAGAASGPWLVASVSVTKNGTPQSGLSVGEDGTLTLAYKVTDTIVLGEAVRVGYSFDGWTGGTVGDAVAASVTIAPGARAEELSFQANFTASDVSFEVRHYLRDVASGTYTLDGIETRSAKADAAVTLESVRRRDLAGFSQAVPAMRAYTDEGTSSYAGFGVLPTEAQLEAGLPAENGASVHDGATVALPGGTLVVCLYYARDSYVLSVPRPAAQGGTEGVGAVRVAHGRGTANAMQDPVDVTGGSVDVEYGQKVQVTVELRPGYRLSEGAGWDGTSAHASLSHSASVADGRAATATVAAMPAAGLVVAVTPERVPYDVTYDLGGDLAGTPASHEGNPTGYDVGDAFALVDPVLPGYVFDGWTVTLSGGVGGGVAGALGTGSDQAVGPSATPVVGYRVAAGTHGDLAFVAHWHRQAYSVAYDANLGEGFTGRTVATYDGAATIAQGGFVRTGYSFAGWNTAPDGSGRGFVAGGATDRANLTTSANGSASLVGGDGRVTCSLVAGGHDVVAADAAGTATRAHAAWRLGGGAAVAVVDAPWDGSGVAHGATLPAGASLSQGDVRLDDATAGAAYAISAWARGTGSLAMSLEGQDAPAVGGAVPVTSAAGFVRVAWVLVVGTAPAANVLAEADARGPLVASLSSAEGDLVVCGVELVHVAAGTTRGAWADAASLLGSARRADWLEADTTLYAQWEAHSYTVRFDANRAYPSPQTAVQGAMEDLPMTYDVAVPLPANGYASLDVDRAPAPALLASGRGLYRRGYSFVGWNTSADGSGDAYADGQEVANLAAGDGDVVTLYAQWEATPSAGEAYACYADDGSLTFFRSELLSDVPRGEGGRLGRRETIDIAGQAVAGEVYAGVESLAASRASDVPWVADHVAQLRGASVAAFDADRRQKVMPTSLAYWFCGAAWMAGDALDLRGLDTAGTTDMTAAFAGCARLSSLDVRTLDTSSATSLARMFDGCSVLAALDVSGFDVGDARDLSRMFAGCASLVSLVLGDLAKAPGTGELTGTFWNTAAVEAMAGMFEGCAALETLDLSGLDTSQVASMASLLDGCGSLVEARFGHAGDGSSWSVAAAADLSRMFAGCARLGALDLTRFDLSAAEDVGAMFDGCARLSYVELPASFRFAAGTTRSVLPDPPADSLYSGDWAELAGGVAPAPASELCAAFADACVPGTYAWTHLLPVTGGAGDDAAFLWASTVAVGGAATALWRRRRRDGDDRPDDA